MDRNYPISSDTSLGDLVALRKESVDRNRQALVHCEEQTVALRKESVDRNRPGGPEQGYFARRSPQGERG